MPTAKTRTRTSRGASRRTPRTPPVPPTPKEFFETWRSARTLLRFVRWRTGLDEPDEPERETCGQLLAWAPGMLVIQGSEGGTPAVLFTHTLEAIVPLPAANRTGDTAP